MLPSAAPAPVAHDDAVLPGAEKAEKKEADPGRRPAPAAAGGLPKGFDAQDGPWRKVTSDDPFERLLLDPSARPVTTEDVIRNAGLLLEFWNQKLAAFSQGAAHDQLLRRFAGGNEALFRSYPARIQAALDLLSNGASRAAAVAERERIRVAKGRAQIDVAIAVAVADGWVGAAERDHIVERGVDAGLTADETLAYLIEQVSRYGAVLEPSAEVQTIDIANKTAEAASNPVVSAPPVASSKTRSPLQSLVIAGAAAAVVLTVWQWRDRPMDTQSRGQAEDPASQASGSVPSTRGPDRSQPPPSNPGFIQSGGQGADPATNNVLPVNPIVTSRGTRLAEDVQPTAGASQPAVAPTAATGTPETKTETPTPVIPPPTRVEDTVSRDRVVRQERFAELRRHVDGRLVEAARLEKAGEDRGYVLAADQVREAMQAIRFFEQAYGGDDASKGLALNTAKLRESLVARCRGENEVNRVAGLPEIPCPSIEGGSE